MMKQKYISPTTFVYSVMCEGIICTSQEEAGWDMQLSPRHEVFDADPSDIGDDAD